jgi:DNA-binding MarR family transcriptional regulator
MVDDVFSLLENSNKLNASAMSLTRCLILALLSYFLDGIQYRELKVALKISDGKLIANLNKLKDMQYVKKFETEINHNKIDIYTLSPKGRNELNKVIEWMELVQRVAKEDKECQRILTK